MSYVKFYSGQEENLNKKAIENGSIYVTMDTKKMYADLRGERVAIKGADSSEPKLLWEGT